jgi:ornithine cyclodeaminase/alanine dehydrogenase-like protein (mu-crystallin family)
MLKSGDGGYPKNNAQNNHNFLSVIISFEIKSYTPTLIMDGFCDY